jgi:DNA-binding transcriptional LysR family regulator
MQSDRWLGIELRHLAALQAIAGERSFHAAAARLGYSQSAVSQQIATLERIVGGKLIERPGGPRAVSLTELGALVLRHAETIIARMQAAQADAAAMVAGGIGALRIGTYQSVGEHILPALVSRFRHSHPGVEISLVESESDDELLAAVERGELDLAFALVPLPDGPFASVELLRDPWMLLVPADSPLAHRGEPVSLDDAARLPLIGARLHRCRMQVDAHFRARGLEPTYVFRTDENGTVHGLVAAGVGIGIISRLAIDPATNVSAHWSSAPRSPPESSLSHGIATATDNPRATPSSTRRWSPRSRWRPAQPEVEPLAQAPMPAVPAPSMRG